MPPVLNPTSFDGVGKGDSGEVGEEGSHKIYPLPHGQEGLALRNWEGELGGVQVVRGRLRGRRSHRVQCEEM